MKKDPKFAELHKHAANNEIEILHSTNCSCFFCRQTYSARKVNDWINDDRGVTAICPECGMDAVIGDACGIVLDKVLLKEMNLAYYGEDYMEKHPVAAQTYVNRYKANKITHKKANEALYIQYLSLLANRGNAQAAYDLAALYENGSEFTEKSPKDAFSYYAMGCLKDDGSALTRLGILSESGALGKVDERGAYECYSKGMAMGSLESLVRFADCYSKGIFVQKDVDFAADILLAIWPESYARFTESAGKDINIFPDVAYRLGVIFMDGFYGKSNPSRALRFFLFAEFGFHLMQTVGILKGELQTDFADNEARLSKIAASYKLAKNDPVFDNDTFQDTLEFVGLNQIPASHNYVFSPAGYDASAHAFSCDISYDTPLLVIDAGNLFCGFVPGTIRWDFVDVSNVKFGRGQAFNDIQGNGEEGWDFVMVDNGVETTVASILLFANRPSKKKSLEDKKRKA
jgi:TPR repeat protein